MHGREQFETEVRLEPFNELTDPIEPFLRLGSVFERSPGGFHSPGKQFDDLFRCIVPHSVTRHEKTFDLVQNAPQVFSIRTVGSLKIAKMQRFSSLLHEIHQLVNLQG